MGTNPTSADSLEAREYIGYALGDTASVGFVYPRGCVKVLMKARYRLICRTIRDALIEVLGDTADFDGHHVGSGRTNIFIFTPDAPATFARVKPVLETRHYLGALTAAYRPVDGARYRVIWPEGRK